MSPQPTRAGKRPPAQASRGSSGPPIFVIAVVALVVVAVVVAAVIGLTGDDSEEGRAFGPVTVTGEPLATLEDTASDPAGGQPAPVIQGETPDGDPVTIDPAKDGPMVLAVLAHWCPHCQVEVPRIVDVVDDNGELDGVKVAAVATASDSRQDNFPAGEWLDDEGWPGPVVLDNEESSAASAYGVSSYPFLVAIDKDGNVVHRATGELPEDQLRALFAAAGSGEPPT
jgi:thiol-disulfide isomerase/thioredoxin